MITPYGIVERDTVDGWQQLSTGTRVEWVLESLQPTVSVLTE